MIQTSFLLRRLRTVTVVSIFTVLVTACTNNTGDQKEVQDTRTASPDSASHTGDTATYEQMPLKTTDSMPK